MSDKKTATTGQSKPQTGTKPTAVPSPSHSGPSLSSAPTVNAHQCRAKNCKSSPSKFGFCKEHFDQFKFGLITKNGEFCSDHDKKSDQFEDWKKANRKKAA